MKTKKCVIIDFKSRTTIANEGPVSQQTTSH